MDIVSLPVFNFVVSGDPIKKFFFLLLVCFNLTIYNRIIEIIKYLFFLLSLCGSLRYKWLWERPLSEWRNLHWQSQSVSVYLCWRLGRTYLPKQWVLTLPHSSSSAVAADVSGRVLMFYLVVTQTSTTAALLLVRTEASVEIWSTTSTVNVPTAGRERRVTPVSSARVRVCTWLPSCRT